MDYDSGSFPITVDDFLCSGDPAEQFITDIEFYGWSFYGDDNYVVGFRITFWDDVPATDQDESHPGNLLYEANVGWQYLGDNQFKINLPEDRWFDQGLEERVLWIGIQGDMVTDDLPDAFYWEFRHWDDPHWGDDAAFWSDYFGYPPWANWGWMTPDDPAVYDGPFPDGWYASADMRFRLNGIPEPASICLLGLCMVLLRRR